MFCCIRICWIALQIAAVHEQPAASVCRKRNQVQLAPNVSPRVDPSLSFMFSRVMRDHQRDRTYVRHTRHGPFERVPIDLQKLARKPFVQPPMKNRAMKSLKQLRDDDAHFNQKKRKRKRANHHS